MLLPLNWLTILQKTKLFVLSIIMFKQILNLLKKLKYVKRNYNQ
jgi:hypothetical protein